MGYKPEHPHKGCCPIILTRTLIDLYIDPSFVQLHVYPAQAVDLILLYIFLIGVPCPLIGCINLCPFGYVRDENGCPTCKCRSKIISIYFSAKGSPIIWSCYVNISVLIDHENNQFLKKCIMIMI